MAITMSETHESGVGVLDKVSAVLTVLEEGPATVIELAEETGFARGTVDRLVHAMTEIQLVARDQTGRVVVGPRMVRLAAAAGVGRIKLRETLKALRVDTGATAVRLFQLQDGGGIKRVCIAEALDPTVPQRMQVGIALPLQADPIAQVFLAWQRDDGPVARALREVAPYTDAVLDRTRRQGWAQGFSPRRDLVVLAAPVREPGQAMAVVALYGSVRTLSTAPGRKYGRALLDAAQALRKFCPRDLAEALL